MHILVLALTPKYVCEHLDGMYVYHESGAARAVLGEQQGNNLVYAVSSMNWDFQIKWI